MSEPVWQYRLYYGNSNIGPGKDGWTEWEDVEEGVTYYSPHALLEDATALGKIEFRKYVPTCDLCDGPVEDHNLCGWHLNQEWDGYLEDNPWPDFRDDLPGMWEESDLTGGEADTISEHPREADLTRGEDYLDRYI